MRATQTARQDLFGRFPGVEALILKTLAEEGEVRPPAERLAQEYFWMAAAALQARGLCVADQKRGIVEAVECAECGGTRVLPILDVDGMERDERHRLCQAEVDANPGIQNWIEPAEVPYGRADQKAFKLGFEREFPHHDLRARCALLVQRWRQAGGERERCAIDLEEVLGETEVRG